MILQDQKKKDAYYEATKKRKQTLRGKGKSVTKSKLVQRIEQRQTPTKPGTSDPRSKDDIAMANEYFAGYQEEFTLPQCELLVVWHRHLFGIGLYLGLTYGGGSCLFMCIAEHVYNNPKEHEMVRDQIVDHICRNWDEWSQEVLAAYTEEGVKSKEDYKTFVGREN